MEHDKSYNLRNNSVYIEPRCKLELYKQSFLSSLSMRNSLPIRPTISELTFLICLEK